MMKQTTGRATAERCIPAPILERYRPLVEKFGTPLYVYDLATMKKNISEIVHAMPEETKIHIAAFSMGAIPVLMSHCGWWDEKVGIMCNSKIEVEIAERAQIRGPIILSASGLPRETISFAAKNHIYVNLDSMNQIGIFASEGGKECGLRVRLNMEPPEGARASAMGKHSRIGVPEQEIMAVMEASKKNGVQINGLHMYVGTNVLDYRKLLNIFDYFLTVIERIPAEFKDKITVINLGGGFGVDYSGEGKKFDFEEYGKGVEERLKRLKELCSEKIRIAIEPGRAALADSAVLLTRVTEVKHYEGMDIVNVDSTSSHFSRYSLYGENHPIVAMDKLDEPNQFTAKIAGCTTLSIDYLGEAELPHLKIDDILAIAMTGAYGYAMRSSFLDQPWPAVAMVDGSAEYEIARRQAFEDIVLPFDTIGLSWKRGCVSGLLKIDLH